MTVAWDQVVLDCHGGLEPVPILYRIAVGLVALAAGWQTDAPALTVVTPPAYVETVSETTVTVNVEPRLGECVMVEVTAVDGADNADTDPCGGG
jgi:hypothetical protein